MENIINESSFTSLGLEKGRTDEEGCTLFKDAQIEIRFYTHLQRVGDYDYNVAIEDSFYMVSSLSMLQLIVMSHKGVYVSNPHQEAKIKEISYYKEVKVSEEAPYKVVHEPVEKGLTVTVPTDSLDELNTELGDEGHRVKSHCVVHEVPVYGIFWSILFMSSEGDKPPMIPKEILLEKDCSREIERALVAEAGFDVMGTDVGGFVVAFNICDDDFNKITVGTVAHEALHLTNYVMDTVGIRLSNKSEEAYAYLLDYFVDTIMQEANRNGFHIYQHKNVFKRYVHQ